MKLLRIAYSVVMFIMCTTLCVLMAFLKPNAPIDSIIIVSIPIVLGYYASYVVYCIVLEDNATKETNTIMDDLTDYWQTPYKRWLDNQNN